MTGHWCAQLANTNLHWHSACSFPDEWTDPLLCCMSALQHPQQLCPAGCEEGRSLSLLMLLRPLRAHTGRVHFHAAEDGGSPLGLSLPLELLLVPPEEGTPATLEALLGALERRCARSGCCCVACRQRVCQAAAGTAGRGILWQYTSK